MADHNKVYGVCENKCLVPIYSKEEVDDLTEEVITTRIGELKLVVLTQAEYDALSVKDENTIYFIEEI